MKKQNKKMTTKSTILWGTLIGAVILGSCYFTHETGESRGRPNKVYSLDVNEDGLPDIVLQSKHTPFDITRYDAFIASQDSEGNLYYTPLEEMAKKAIDSLETKYSAEDAIARKSSDSARSSHNQRRKALESSVDGMIRKVNTHKYGEVK